MERAVLPIEDIWAIEQTLLALFRAIDADDEQGVASRFAGEGRWHRASGVKIGRPMILDEMRARPKKRTIQHLISNIIFEACSDRSAAITFKSLAYSGDSSSSGDVIAMALPLGLEVYTATLVKYGDSWLVWELAASRLFQRR